MARLELGGQATAGFRDDLNVTLYEPTLPPIGLERIERHPVRLAANMLDRLDDVAEVQGV